MIIIKNILRKKGRRASQINSNVRKQDDKRRKSTGSFEIHTFHTTPKKSKINKDDSSDVLSLDNNHNTQKSGDSNEYSNDNSVEVIDDNKLFDQDVALIPKKRKFINGINSAVTSVDFYNSKKWQDYCRWKDNILKEIKI